MISLFFYFYQFHEQYSFGMQIIEKLSAKAPDTETKIKTLKSIAEEHGIEWDSKALLDELQKTKNDLLVSIYDITSCLAYPMVSID